MDLFKKCENFVYAKQLREADIYPYFHKLETRQAPEVVMEGKDIIMIGSNNYLGLTSHPEVCEAAIKAVEKYGSGCSGSRFLNGTLDIHVALEKELAEFLHKEDVVTFSTGFQSNLGIISAIAGRTDYILCDKENHASIYDGCRLSFAKMLRYNHSDMEDLERQLQTVPDTAGILIVTDGVFSMGGDICKLPEIVRLAKKYGARVMVDDAHGLGVLGAHGRGTAEHFGFENEVDIYMGTFSKSLASLGGYMAATKEVCEYVRHNSRPFIFSASITPAAVASARAALNILKREPERVVRLREISGYMRDKLKNLGVDLIDSGEQTPIIPIYTYYNIRTFTACKMLFERGVYVNSTISPAVPVGSSLLRTSYMATHTEEQMDKAAAAIKEVLDLVKDINE
ncbi:MAG: aminotransferase class I/II-fold pyridoxal phosphate-dependent enzyme [Clostridia bacterium]|nr:aminotransferase class I/II-fold pyridoxal phosphate-dependent enzyme [Clostridia bacterium]